MENWVRFDEKLVAHTSLEMLLFCLNSIKTKPTYWQWVYITLHSAVQSFMVLALTGTNSLLIYKDVHREKWLREYQDSKRTTSTKLDSFKNLYEKVKSDCFLLYENTQKFIPTDSQEKSIEQLNTFRNEFVHYKYGKYSIRLNDSSFRIVSDCLDFIEFLGFESNNVFWDCEIKREKIKKVLEECGSSIVL